MVDSLAHGDIEGDILETIAAAEGDAVAGGFGEVVVGETEAEGTVFLYLEVELDAVGHADREADEGVELLADLDALHADRGYKIVGDIEYGFRAVVIVFLARDGGVGVEMADAISGRIAVGDGDVGEPFFECRDFVEAIVGYRPVGQGGVEERRERVGRDIFTHVSSEETGE